MKSIKKISLFALIAFGAIQVNAQEVATEKDPEAKFAAIDANQDGSLDLEELSAHKTKKWAKDAEEKGESLTAEQLATKSAEVKEWFAAQDANQDGLISLDEFKAALAKKQEAKENPEVQ